MIWVLICSIKRFHGGFSRIFLLEGVIAVSIGVALGKIDDARKSQRNQTPMSLF